MIVIKCIPPLFVKTRQGFNQTSTYHIAEVVRFLLLKSYLPISTYRIYHCLHCSLVTNSCLYYVGILRWLLHAQFHYPGYEQFVTVRRPAGSPYYAYMSLYNNCQNVSVKVARAPVQYIYPPAYRESRLLQTSIGLL